MRTVPLDTMPIIPLSISIPTVMSSTEEERQWLWGGSILVMAMLHAGILAVSVLWHPVPDQAAPPPAAMMIELAPLPEQSAPPTEKPLGIRQEAARPEERTIEESPKPETVVKKAEVILHKPRPKPVSKPREEAPPAEKTVEQTTAPLANDNAETVKSLAPSRAPSPSAAPSNAVLTWQGFLRAHLERYKRYPAMAQLRRQQGVAHVRFAMNRDGNILWARQERSSGYDLLDNESLALLARAQPLPVPPPEAIGDSIEIVVPIQFFLK